MYLMEWIGIFMYKAMNQLVPGQISEMFTCLSTQYSYQTRSMVNGNLFIPANHLMAEQRLLRYAGSKLWNEIPYEIRNANSLNNFKINSMPIFWNKVLLEPTGLS